MSLAERHKAGPPRRNRCSIGKFEEWLAETHPGDDGFALMVADPGWSDRETIGAVREEYGRDESEQQLGFHRRHSCGCYK